MARSHDAEITRETLEGKSVEELADLIALARSVHGEKVQAEKSAVIERLKSEMATYGVTQGDLFGAPSRSRGKPTAAASGRASPPAKYANPANPSETWSGRGRASRWLQVLEAEGHKREEYLIDKAAAE